MITLSENFWEIRQTKQKGRGVFAKNNIPAGTIIGEYTGTVLHPRDTEIDEENFYLMYYHDYAVISPDVEKPGAHLLNHSCTPNSWIYIYKGHTIAFTLRQISVGEELTISYLLAPKTIHETSCVHLCKCGEKNCTGTLHISENIYKAWREITEKQSKETRKQKVTYGKPLPPLPSYPEIPKEYITKIKQLIRNNW